MTSRRKRRGEWRKTKSGLWALSLGRRGQRVLLFQTEKDGNFYRAVHDPERGRHRLSLGTNDRDKAEQIAEGLLQSMERGVPMERETVVRLGELADAFVVEAPTFHTAKESTRRDTRMRVAILRAAIGDDREVSTLREDEVRQFERRRLAGGITYASDKITPAVRQHSVQADVKVLKQMLRWACTRTAPGGNGAWRGTNPLPYVRSRGERSPARPVTSDARYNVTIKAMQTLQRRYAEEPRTSTSARGRMRAESRARTWLRAEFALWLIRRTGQRRGAIMGVRWADFDFDARNVTWRAETNKSNRRSEVRYPEEFFDTVREFQHRPGGFRGCVFATEDDPSKPLPNEMLSQWLMRAETLAGVPKLEQGGLHPYRRLWVSERPMCRVRHSWCAADGWTWEPSLDATTTQQKTSCS